MGDGIILFRCRHGADLVLRGNIVEGGKVTAKVGGLQYGLPDKTSVLSGSLLVVLDP